MIATGYKDLQLLLDRPKRAGMLISCYADTAVVEGFESHWRQYLNDEARRVRERLSGHPKALGEFERQLALIRGHLELAGERAARGMAVFTAAGWDNAPAIDSDAPFMDLLVDDEEPYLVPFMVDDHLRSQYLVILTDTHHGRIYGGPAPRGGSIGSRATCRGRTSRRGSGGASSRPPSRGITRTTSSLTTKSSPIA
jgi:hypothetical protein